MSKVCIVYSEPVGRILNSISACLRCCTMNIVINDQTSFANIKSPMHISALEKHMIANSDCEWSHMTAL